MRSRAGVTGEVYWAVIWQLRESCKLGLSEGTFLANRKTQGVRWPALVIS